MMIMALMAGYDSTAKTRFDGLYRFFKDHLTQKDPPLPLMAWLQVEKGCRTRDSGTATDGDLDIAYALLLADKQWGSDGDIDYLQEAINVINAIMDKEINREAWLPFLANGDEEWLSKARYKYGTRPSGFIGDHMRAFESATGDTRWSDVIDAIYTLIVTMQTNYSPLTGLLPDFVQDTNTAPRPVSRDYLEGRWDGQYSWNACRVPWRLGTDYLTSGDTRALDALDKINAWIREKTGERPSQIVSGYTRGGKPFGNELHPMAFVAPFGVGAMVSMDNQEWLDRIWNLTVNRPRRMEDYYGNTLKLLAMITMSGNWWQP